MKEQQFWDTWSCGEDAVRMSIKDLGDGDIQISFEQPHKKDGDVMSVHFGNERVRELSLILQKFVMQNVDLG
jgi:hypothetical protein